MKVCSDGYHFEPSVGARIFQKMLNGQKDKITVLTMRQFDAEDENIVMRDNRIEKIRILNRETAKGKTSSASPEPGASTNIGAVRKGTAARSRKTMPCSPTITASV